ncbi:MAG: hypothetical protein J4478_00165 [Candidatus Diapherotrites archaeon]|uniref:Uncharacterized protein n=1 Tax=Candidatus Iainarchaeum sp. TaxID=3101447 RepID=A0A7J4K277_9ARCH|nr:hypothetical protein [Candidatus Diapherotrites archaeon]HIH21616.1 hypothetical protein [Candidatus Diapherotrites archaeon]
MPSKLLNLALSSKKILEPFRELDCLLYYAACAEKLQGFLKGKEIASKVYIPNGPELLKRGSELEPLFIEEIAGNVDEGFLKKRTYHLEEVRSELSKTQEKLWGYFFPRKYCTLFYATNGEHPGKPIERFFFDIDRKGSSSEEDARLIACTLAKLILEDKEFGKIGKFKLFPMWTGSSFHLYLLLEKMQDSKIYDKSIQFSKSNPFDSFTGKWVFEISKSTGLQVIGGHEKQEGLINIDTSQTPSGKLARAPFSLHLKDAVTVDGIALPLTLKELCTKGIVKKLKAFTPEKVVKELEELAGKIPERKAF